jgi:hypothetical protein
LGHHGCGCGHGVMLGGEISNFKFQISNGKKTDPRSAGTGI